jgi:hypothetical protein
MSAALMNSRQWECEVADGWADLVPVRPRTLAAAETHTGRRSKAQIGKLPTQPPAHAWQLPTALTHSLPPPPADSPAGSRSQTPQLAPALQQIKTIVINMSFPATRQGASADKLCVKAANTLTLVERAIFKQKPINRGHSNHQRQLWLCSQGHVRIGQCAALDRHVDAHVPIS